MIALRRLTKREEKGLSEWVRFLVSPYVAHLFLSRLFGLGQRVPFEAQLEDDYALLFGVRKFGPAPKKKPDR